MSQKLLQLCRLIHSLHIIYMFHQEKSNHEVLYGNVLVWLQGMCSVGFHSLSMQYKDVRVSTIYKHLLAAIRSCTRSLVWLAKQPRHTGPDHGASGVGYNRCIQTVQAVSLHAEVAQNDEALPFASRLIVKGKTQELKPLHLNIKTLTSYVPSINIYANIPHFG